MFLPLFINCFICRLINLVVVLLILSGETLQCRINLISKEKLKCIFSIVNFDVAGELYSYYVTSFDGFASETLNITDLTATHIASINDTDVKGIYIYDTNTNYFPEHLGILFNLTAFSIEKTLLFEIKSKDFKGMEELVDLNLENNKLRSIPSNAFKRMTKLRIINLNYNQIEGLPSRLFSNNLNLEQIRLYGNQIKFIGSGLFHELKVLESVELRANLCLDYYYDGTSVIELNDDIQLNCTESN